MANQVSAVDSISPAFLRTKKLLFGPFRFGLWARFAVVALVTGEVGGGGGGSSLNFGNMGNSRSGGGRWRVAADVFREPGWEQIQPYLPWIVMTGVLVLGLMVLWIYSDAVYRFILLDSVLTGQCRLREGWRRWREAGRRYLLWAIGFGFGSLLVLGAVAGVPALLAYSAGWFEKPDDHLWGLIGGGVLLALVVIVLVVMMSVIDLLARDFLVPVMAFEGVGAVEGWHKLLEILRADKAAYTVYVLMKIVLAFGSAIIFTILNILVILVLLIPLVILGMAAFFAGRAAGIPWDASGILLIAGLGLLAIAGILYVMGFVYTPGLVFFQSYTLEFFAPRYGPLRSKMFPASPIVSPPETPPMTSPWPPPEPAAT